MAATMEQVGFHHQRFAVDILMWENSYAYRVT